VPLAINFNGDAEFAELKMQEQIYRHQIARLENVGLEITGDVMYGKQKFLITL